MNTHPRNKKAGPLKIRVAGEQELKRFNQLLDERHPQQTPHPVGRELRVVIEQDGDWIAVMLWTSACQRLQDRDEWIGWTNAQRAQRLNLLVRLRRYLLLHEAGTRPNLVGALALLRNALFAIHQPHHENYGGLNGFTEAVAANVAFVIRNKQLLLCSRIALSVENGRFGTSPTYGDTLTPTR